MKSETTRAAATIVTADALKRFTTDIFARAGMSPAHAAIVADVLVWANMRAIDSHGVIRVPRYVHWMGTGELNPTRVITVRTDTPAAVVIDADRAAGVSTSPISIAVPGGDGGPLVFDMGTGVIAAGKLLQARRTGQPIPEGSALDRHGNPTTDPKAAEIPLPLGGPKGSGLSLMIECLTSLVVSNAVLAESLEGTPLGRRHRQNGLALAIDVARFGDPGAFRAEVDRLVRALKALPRERGDVEILMPGERGRRAQERRTRDGIPLPRALVDELRALATRLGVPMFPHGNPG